MKIITNLYILSARWFLTRWKFCHWSEQKNFQSEHTRSHKKFRDVFIRKGLVLGQSYIRKLFFQFSWLQMAVGFLFDPFKYEEVKLLWGQTAFMIPYVWSVWNKKKNYWNTVGSFKFDCSYSHTESVEVTVVINCIYSTWRYA